MYIPDSAQPTNANSTNSKRQICIHKARAQFNIYEQAENSTNDGKVTNGVEYRELVYYYDKNIKSFTAEAKNFIHKLLSAFMDKDTSDKWDAQEYNTNDILRRFPVIDKSNYKEVEAFLENHNVDNISRGEIDDIIRYAVGSVNDPTESLSYITTVILAKPAYQ